jgi:Spondin_N
MRRYALLIAPALLAVFALTGTASTSQADDDDGIRTYRVTIENETDGQPFSPGVAVTHRKSVNLFRVGQGASPGIEAIAEDGNQGPAVAAAMGTPGITDVFDINQPITREGTTVMGFTDEFTFEIQARPRDRLSLAVMLICTNDGFTGLDSVKLPKDDDSVTYLAQGYDAGTENNTEQSEDIVDPCSALGPAPLAGDPNGNENTAVATSPHGPIHHHPGILGGGDLTPSLHNWRNPVAEITIELVDDDDDGDDDD